MNQFQERIQKLKAADDRAELKKVLAEKKTFMHTAPSLLRNPEPIKEVLTTDEFAAFSAKLDALKKSLHDPKGKGQPDKPVEPTADGAAHR